MQRVDLRPALVLRLTRAPELVEVAVKETLNYLSASTW
jgi:hypothetical protein